MAFVLPRPLTEDESRRMADLLHISGELPDFSEARLRELFYGTGTQRSGTRPRTVEVGMVLCRPADGYSAAPVPTRRAPRRWPCWSSPARARWAWPRRRR